jgi:hypothetical protein
MKFRSRMSHSRSLGSLPIQDQVCWVMCSSSYSIKPDTNYTTHNYYECMSSNGTLNQPSTESGAANFPKHPFQMKCIGQEMSVFWMWCHVVWWKYTYVLKETATSIFKDWDSRLLRHVDTVLPHYTASPYSLPGELKSHVSVANFLVSAYRGTWGGEHYVKPPFSISVRMTFAIEQVRVKNEFLYSCNRLTLKWIMH